MNDNYGASEKISGRRDIGGIEVEPICLETIGDSSQLDGVDPIRVSGKDRDGGNTSWKLTPIRDTTAGKILERLEALEAQHLQYVHSHQDRLKARLGESEQAEEEFKKESNQIKSDIYHLAIAQNQANGNGHIN